MADDVFSPINRSRAFEGVVEQIEGAILEGVYAPGDFLPSERALMDQFAVGRSTVREALRILESMGMVRTSPGSRKGAEVQSQLRQSMSRMLQGAIRIEGIPFLDLVEYRMMTGATANFLAAHRRSEEQLAEMSQAIEVMERASAEGDPDAFAQADADFHTAIQLAAGNSLMQMVSAVVESAIVDLVRSVIGDEDASRHVSQRFIALHRTLLRAIADGDGPEAARLARTSLIEAYGERLDPAERERLSLLAAATVPDFAPPAPSAEP